ncbi:MAG TPA: hypothetical protein VN426_07905 [Syntrophomonadaceae bacterium]|nr:hypothetical protein [Syntrophomonadaceae bacterium]
MSAVATKYGPLHGLSSAEFYLEGTLKECVLQELNEVATPWGVLVPQYSDSDVRRKYTSSMGFYQNGAIRRISLNQQTSISTPVGVFPAELLTFYESGNLKRLFPLNGKLSAYWSEEDEYKLAREFDFQFIFGSFKKKIMAIHFYESGAVKSLTFWPQDSLAVQTPVGEVEVRIGISLHVNGRIRSLEPRTPMTVHTPIGDIRAFHADTQGIHGDDNSLVFDEDGSICSLVTSSDMIVVSDGEGKKSVFAPGFKDRGTSITPLRIDFCSGLVRIGNGKKNQYEINRHRFFIHHLPGIINHNCDTCSGCNACG